MGRPPLLPPPGQQQGEGSRQAAGQGEEQEAAPRSLAPRRVKTVPPPATAPGRVPPSSVEAEEQLLSACLLDGGDVVARCIEGKIQSASFYVPANRLIYGKLLEIHLAGKPVDLAVLAEELKATRQLDEIGGYPYLTRNSGRIPTTAGAAYFIDKVRELALLRETIRSATGVVEDCYGYTGPEDLAKIIAQLDATLHRARGVVSDTSAWSVVAASDFVAKPPEIPPEVIQGLLYAGGTFMMSGASKSMKTYTMIAAGLAAAAGREWLGFRCAPVPVIYLNLELQGFAMATRVKAVAAAMGIEPPAGFYVANLRGKLVTIETVEAQLAALLRKTGAGLVIIDPHYKISAASGVEENSNDEQGLLLYRLENAVCQSGAALMIAHHFSKGDKSQTKAIDRAAGGGALARWPDVVMTLTEHEEDGCATAEFSLRNFAPVAPFVVRWNYPTWTRDGSLNPTKLKSPGRKEEHSPAELLAKLSDGMTGREWKAAAGLTDSTFDRKRNALKQQGKIRESSGCYYHAAP